MTTTPTPGTIPGAGLPHAARLGSATDPTDPTGTPARIAELVDDDRIVERSASGIDLRLAQLDHSRQVTQAESRRTDNRPSTSHLNSSQYGRHLATGHAIKYHGDDENAPTIPELLETAAALEDWIMKGKR